MKRVMGEESEVRSRDEVSSPFAKGKI